MIFKNYFTLIIILFFISCNEDVKQSNFKNKLIKIDKKSTALTNNEISGNYKGNKDINEVLNSAVMLTFKEDGSYIARIFANGIELTEEEISPQLGKYKIDIIEVAEKSPYGEIINIEYSHRIYCYWNSPFGERVSMYYIHYDINDNGRIYLLPHIPHYIGLDVSLYKTD